MNTTLSQQLKAVKKSCEMLLLPQKDIDALHDAASTLTAVKLIGEANILITNELIGAVKQFLKDSEDETMHHPSYWKMKAIVERLPK